MPNVLENQSDINRQRREEFALLLIGYEWIDAASKFWSLHVPPRYADMLATGPRRGSQHDIKRLSIVFSQSAEHDFRDAAERNDFEKLAVLMAEEYTAMTILAVGGVDNVDEADFDAANGQPGEPGSAAFSLRKLLEFKREVQAEDAGSVAQIVARSALYAAAGNGIFERVRRHRALTETDKLGRLKVKFERNLLGPAEDHCMDTPTTEGCLEITRAGWQPIGSLPQIGQRSCGPNCKCSLEYSLIGPAIGSN